MKHVMSNTNTSPEFFLDQGEDRVNEFTASDMADQLRDLSDDQLAAIFIQCMTNSRPGVLYRKDTELWDAEIRVNDAMRSIVFKQAQLAQDEWSEVEIDEATARGW